MPLHCMHVVHLVLGSVVCCVPRLYCSRNHHSSCIDNRDYMHVVLSHQAWTSLCLPHIFVWPAANHLSCYTNRDHMRVVPPHPQMLTSLCLPYIQSHTQSELSLLLQFDRVRTRVVFPHLQTSIPLCLPQNFVWLNVNHLSSYTTGIICTWRSHIFRRGHHVCPINVF